MKHKIAITSAFLAASSLTMAEIKINEFLSFEGFVDMSYSHSDTDFEGEGVSDNSFGIDQVEIDWLFNFGKVTAQIDLEYEETGDETEVEQAFVSYDLGNGSALTMGRYESMLGLEAKEPTGLYQYSNAYSILSSELSGGSPLPQYAQGVKFTKTTDTSFLGLSIQDQAFGTGVGSLGGSGGDLDNPDGTYAVEAAASITNGDTTYFIGGVYEDGDDFSDVWFLNGHVSHQNGPWTVGAEVFVGNADLDLGGFADVDLDLMGGLIMANYAYNECSSITARISFVQYDTVLSDGGSQSIGFDVEGLKYTLAHNYALTDNLAIITEVSYSDLNIDVSGNFGEGPEDLSADGDVLLGAVEVLFTF
tara:strand:- start:276 stop:1361 length:1086 start_codon:yes stop_codon:yes gene_type:complete